MIFWPRNSYHKSLGLLDLGLRLIYLLVVLRSWGARGWSCSLLCAWQISIVWDWYYLLWQRWGRIERISMWWLGVKGNEFLFVRLDVDLIHIADCKFQSWGYFHSYYLLGNLRYNWLDNRFYFQGRSGFRYLFSFCWLASHTEPLSSCFSFKIKSRISGFDAFYVEECSRKTFVSETARDDSCFGASTARLLWVGVRHRFALFGLGFFHLAVCVLLIFDIGISALTIATNLRLFCYHFCFLYNWQHFWLCRFLFCYYKFSFDFLLLMLLLFYSLWLCGWFWGKNLERLLGK